eukprot:8170827-Lingulodinium_polyedra.AAC.1
MATSASAPVATMRPQGAMAWFGPTSPRSPRRAGRRLRTRRRPTLGWRATRSSPCSTGCCWTSKAVARCT